MEKGVIKKLIGLFIALIVIILILIILINYKDEKQEEDIIDNKIEETNQEETISAKEQEEKERIYIVQQCIYTYLNTINVNNANYYKTDENGNIEKFVNENEKIYKMLNPKYIEDNNITLENIEEKIEKVDYKTFFIPLKTEYISSNNLYKYIMYGYITDIKYNFKKYVFFIVNIDLNNLSFSIEPLIAEKYENINEVNLKSEEIEEIQKNEENSFNYPQVNDEIIAKNYLDTYKKMILSNSEEMYKYINEDYKNNRFNTYEKFQQYVEENKEKIKQISLQKYQVNNYNNYVQYVCIDQFNNYYIFNEKNILDYDIILDLYTIDLPQFIEKYNNSSNEEKIVLNIEKIFNAINNNDSEYVYNKLNTTFKQNNFPNLIDLENYFKENLYGQNNVQYNNYKVSGDTYIYELIITDSNDESKNIKLNIIMKLLENTDFTFSFSMI